MEFLYGELSIFNEVIRINFLTHDAEVDRLAGVMQQFPWFAIQKMLETKQASLVSQKLVESTLYSNFLDSDLGAFLVFIALLLFLYCLLGCPFQSVIEQVLKEIVRIGGVSTAAIVEIAKEAVVAKIRGAPTKIAWTGRALLMWRTHQTVVSWPSRTPWTHPRALSRSRRRL